MPKIDKLSPKLREIAGESHINDDPDKLKAYSVDGKKPKIIVSPGTIDEVSKVVAYANQQRLTIIPRGNGTKMALGGIPKTLDVVLSLLNLNRVVEYEPADLVVTAEAGLRLAELQKTLLKNSQRLPIDPPYTDATTLGGLVSANSSGPMRYCFGSCRDLLLGVRVAAASVGLIFLPSKIPCRLTGPP
jgi:glycolate oxidase FAD binding subunit